MNFLTVSFSEEDRARIDRLAAALEVLAATAFHRATDAIPTNEEAPVPPPVFPAAPQAEAPAAHPVADPFPAPAVETSTPAPAPAPAAAVPTLAEFQKRLTQFCSTGEDARGRVRAAINEYAAAASEVPEDKRLEILARLGA